jgi:hypothetical protein
MRGETPGLMPLHSLVLFAPLSTSLSFPRWQRRFSNLCAGGKGIVG